MVTPSMDLALAVFLLCGLVFLSRQRSPIAAVDRDSYRYMAGGLSVLSLMSVIGLLASTGLFHSVPFLSDPFGLKLTLWTGVIAGSIFLVSGVSEYSSAARRLRLQDRADSGREDLIKRTAQLVGVESRLSTVLERTLDNMVELYDFTVGAAYRFQRNSGTWSLVRVTGTPALDQEQMRDVMIDTDVLCHPDSDNGQQLAAIAGLPEEFCREPIVLPLMVGTHLYALFVLGPGEEPLGDEAMMNLKLSADLITRKISLDRHRMATEIATRQNAFVEEMQYPLSSRTELRQGMIKLADELTTEFGGEHVSLATIGEGGNMNRYTIGGNGMYLKELGLDRLRLVSHLTSVIRHGKALLIDNVDTSDDEVEVVLIQADMKSLLAVPIIEGEEVQAVISVASHQIGYFTSVHQAMLESIRPRLMSLVIREKHELQLHRLEDRSRALSGLLSESTGEPTSTDKILTTAARLLTAHLGMAMIRISTLEADRTFLKSRVLQSGHELKPSTPANGHMVLSLMPQHQEVLKTGTARVIDLTRKSAMIEESEVCLAFAPEVRSILMLPITNKSGVVGVIALADRREPERLALDPSTMQLAEAAAAIVGLSLPMLPSVQPNRLPPSLAARSSGESGVMDRNARINLSLCGIFGSLEVLRNRATDPTSETVNRYLAIIDKSTCQLQECLTEEVGR